MMPLELPLPRCLSAICLAVCFHIRGIVDYFYDCLRQRPPSPGRIRAHR